MQAVVVQRHGAVNGMPKDHLSRFHRRVNGPSIFEGKRNQEVGVGSGGIPWVAESVKGNYTSTTRSLQGEPPVPVLQGQMALKSPTLAVSNVCYQRSTLVRTARLMLAIDIIIVLRSKADVVSAFSCAQCISHHAVKIFLSFH